MFSKLVLCVVVAVAAAAPQGYGPPPPSYGAPSGPVVPILKDDRQGPDQAGNYNFNFETGDGINRQEQGAPQGPAGAVAAQGGWSFTFPDGTPANFKFVADGAGYRVESPLLPTPPPLPPHAIAQIEFARQQEAAGGPRPQYGAPPPRPGYN
ncbi:cuticle protein AM1199 [Procambarus clarkii]|uniref:cuticle protein AM1199 n=1 Tax=Procambarus clarkii TaxID=6728 RepID=UPI001E670EC0|nr:cuticle protein AM1199-like isoform X5 [Procambarus clarkii]XP_045583637.1 cuticle protein AM1199-like isoform X6 [Procambarus clarkii]